MSLRGRSTNFDGVKQEVGMDVEEKSAVSKWLRGAALFSSAVTFALASYFVMSEFFALPEWIVMTVWMFGTPWVVDFVRFQLEGKHSWSSVKSWRDKIMVACSLVVMGVLGLLSLRLGITSAWVKLLMAAAAILVGYAILCCFGSQDLKHLIRPKTPCK